MPKPAPKTTITKATVEAAVRDGQAGLSWEHPDEECPGLTLRVCGKVVSRSFRGPRLAGRNRRWCVGDHTVTPPRARERSWQVRRHISRGLDPTELLTELLTGVKAADQAAVRVVEKPSWEWSDSVAQFLDYLKKNARAATIGDYRATLENTPELQCLRGRQVCDIEREDIEEAVEAVRLRGVKTHHKKVLVVCRRFFNWLGAGERRRYTSVAPNFLLNAKAAPAERDVVGRRVVNKGIPDALPIGRALAISRSGVLGERASLAIQMVLGTVSRRRGVVGMRTEDYKPYPADPPVYIWFQPPAFRKTADKIQSTAAHQVPLVGWIGATVDALERLRDKGGAGWLFPVDRRAGKDPKRPHMSEGVLNKNLDSMPGVHGALSPHALRRAFGSYGSEVGGFAKGEAKMILDHLEGEGDDVTRGHYDLDPRIARKIEMMNWWTGWLDEQCAAAIAADPMLSDREALRQACYVARYGQDRWDAKISKARKLGIPIWQQPGKAEVPESIEPDNQDL